MRSFYTSILLVLLTACGQQSGEPTAETSTMNTALPYGSWPSIVTAASVVEGSRGLSSLSYDSGYVYWVESRPEEGGRNTIMRWKEHMAAEEVLPAPWNVRTRVQEYGGRSMLVVDGTVWFSNFVNQRVYRFLPGEAPVAITPEADLRYAGCIFDRARNRLICVREDHRVLGEPKNTLVALPLEGVSEGEVLFDESDFVSAVSLSSDGSRVAFTSWLHPNMPWDNTSLWSAGFDDEGFLADRNLHNKGGAESVINPQWGDDKQLYAISDRDNWWKIYKVNEQRFSAVNSGLEEVEIGGPDWLIGQNYYQLLSDEKILVQVMKAGVEHLAILDSASQSTKPLSLASVSIADVLAVDNRLFVINAANDKAAELLETDMKGNVLSLIRTASNSTLDPAWVPEYQLVSFPTGGGATSHGIYFPPTNPDASGPKGETPPLIVSVHGGPTGIATPGFNPKHIYWTSRGFAVLDLNYRGSIGFGREYRRSLYGQWGVADVEDAVAGATWLADQGLVDPKRLLIRGGSAGGYTTLAAHAFHSAFAAGASYYGISDLEALATDTHKFESRYLDQVIGPYPERKDLYQNRSPINHLEGFSAPLLLLQGLDDPVVPPSQSEMIFEALKAKGVPTAYLAFEGESHGFRKAENQIRSLEGELYFYSQVLGFKTAEELPKITIEGNLEL
ncbi:MAG: dipeptidyl aminopeptidase/acylaminoacyl peptidase [Halioglobus sp.]|jgi:dipeptidyl aminopeptidase/acylaminoacyl peptidase